MFQRREVLNPEKHGSLRVLETNDYSYARGEVVAPFVYDEMADIAREYPIVFPAGENVLPAALMGLEAGQNAYVGEDGRWLGSYIPATIRRYPFIFGDTGESQGDKQRYVVMFDADAPHFKDPNGHAVFTAGGKLTDHTKRRMELLEEIQKKLPATRRLVEIIEEAGLLAERVIRIRKPGGQERRIQGLRVIDEKALNRMEGAAFLKLRDSGVLPLVYSQLLSWANFRQGPLAGKYPDLAAKPATKNPAFLFESDDLVDLSGLS